MRSLSIGNIKSKGHLPDFVVALQRDLKVHEGEWESRTLRDYLNAVEEMIRDWMPWTRNVRLPLGDEPTWRMFADILFGAKIYECGESPARNAIEPAILDCCNGLP
jgi:hypothetical protein